MKALKYIKGKLGYGVGAVGLDLSYGMFYSFLAKYLTDVLGMKASFLLILTPIARIWDGINDPMMGTIVDNTHTKIGKYRPWILTGAALNAIVLVFLFSNPFHLSGIAICAYVAIVYILWGMTNTLADIPYWSMVPSFTSDPEERNLISTVARAFSGLGQGIVTIGAPLIMTAVSATEIDGTKVHDSRSYLICAIVCAVCLIMFSSICVASTKERISTAPAEKFSFKKTLSIVKSNDQLLIFMLFAMISNAGWYLTSGVATYYFDVVVGDPNKQSLFSTCSAIGSTVGLLLLPILTKRMSKRKAYQTSLAIAAAGYVGMAVSALAGQLILMDIFYIIGGIGIASMFIAQTIFLADIVDYGEVKLGFRAESITFSMKGFLQKMAYTLQTIIMFASLGISGYDGNLHSNNPQSAKAAITVMLVIIPPVLFVISLLIFTKKFKLHGAFMDEITQTVIANQKKREETLNEA
ncbi:MAG: glycoside-pentoside-hexuronide (GPH):cation symporter [Faecalibacterium sp.]|nr:glycoside-pentoside-hexuronide (GPH):cation symporter [Ruminococcus sp.]MCM1392301.1 glycoside-pentoside-hexuronide (GPH):cation symporter [Ruminococcus sp.]MCM1484713.1 glycoside-pentoside-hexuronide (GPH):cation symporter [Faecalibacterium sp.]